MIPQILHQSGPSDVAKWHPIWKVCQRSWQQHMGNHEYRFWQDDDLDQLVRDHYPDHWSMYQDFPLTIMRIDFARLCMLHRWGGIYADLDYYCYQDFSEEIASHQVVLVENPLGNDPIENSLMASEPGADFWIACMRLSQQRFLRVRDRYPRLFRDISVISQDPRYGRLLRPYMVFYITGTNLVSSAWRNWTGAPISTFPGHVYNNLAESYHPDFRAKHMHSGRWGQEDDATPQQHFQEYQRIRHIDMGSFDFYHDYSQGRLLTAPALELDRNHNGHDDQIGENFAYS